MSYTQEELHALIAQTLDRSYQLYLEKNYGTAAELYRQLLRIDPGCVKAMQMLAVVCCNLREFPEALELALKALELEPNNAMWNNLGMVHSFMGHSEMAIECYREALKFNPKDVAHRTNIAIELKKQGKVAEAEATIREAIDLNPNSAQAHFIYGSFIHEMGRLAESVPFYLKALNLQPDLAMCHFNLAMVYFLTGDWQKAWPEYEWRWRHHGEMFRKTRANFKEPYWTGEDLTDKTVLLYTEQGYGDFIQFVRYVKPLKDRYPGLKVILWSPQDLVGVLKAVDGVDDVLWNLDPMPAFDYHCSLLSVPELWREAYGAGPAPEAYVSPPFRAEIAGSEGKFKVGIVWAGNRDHQHDQHRSVFLKQFKGIAEIPGVKLYSFQKDREPRVWMRHGVVNLTDGADFDLTDLSNSLHDWSHTAALVNEMDMVVSVDTGLAHLAAAMGKKTLVALPFVPDWRWTMEGETTHHYPTMRLFRQEAPGDWTGVFERITEEVKRAV